jgi:hypothetical protein
MVQKGARANCACRPGRGAIHASQLRHRVPSDRVHQCVEQSGAGDASCVLARPSCLAFLPSMAGGRPLAEAVPKRNDPSTKRPDHGPQGHSTELRCRSRRGAIRATQLRHRVPPAPVRQCAEQSAPNPGYGRAAPRSKGHAANRCRLVARRCSWERRRTGLPEPLSVFGCHGWNPLGLAHSCYPSELQWRGVWLWISEPLVDRRTPPRYTADRVAAPFRDPT